MQGYGHPFPFVAEQEHILRELERQFAKIKELKELIQKIKKLMKIY